MSRQGHTDWWLQLYLRSCAVIATSVLLLIVAFVTREAWPGLTTVGISRLFNDPSWHPVDLQFNLVPMIVGTLAVTFGAVTLSAPIGVGTAILLNFYAPHWLARLFRRMIGVLAGIPSVVFGLWGISVILPIIAEISPLGQGQSLLAGVLILGLMTLPTVVVTADAAIAAVAAKHIRSAAALGMGRRAIIWSVVVPAARGGIASGIALQIARSIGETMAVLMICGNIVQVPSSLFAPVRTLTANIALEAGYADSEHRAVLFVTGLVLLFLVATTMLVIEWLTWKLSPHSNGTATVDAKIFAQDTELSPSRTTERSSWDVATNSSSNALPVINSPSSNRSSPELELTQTRAGIQFRPWLLNQLSAIFAWGCVACLSIAFFWLIGNVVWQGTEALLSPPTEAVHAEDQATGTILDALQQLPVRVKDFLTLNPTNVGRDGGIFPMIVSTTLVICVCIAVSLPLGLGTALYLSELTGGREGNLSITRIVRRSLDVLASVPSIVFGLFGNAFFCYTLKMGDSILAGGFTLALMVLPILIRVTEQGIRSVPVEFRHGSAALGLSRWTTLTRIVLPAAAPSIAAGLVLGIGRALSETAALIFTSGYATRMPESLLDSGRTLSVHIFEMAMNVPGGNGHAFATAGMLVLILLVINFLASWLTSSAARWATGSKTARTENEFTCRGIE